MNKKLRLCFIGNMLGRNAGYVTTQGQITADLFSAEGYEVVSFSSKINKAARLCEMVYLLIKHHRRTDLAVLEVYSGLSFIIAETVSFVCKMLGLPLVMVLHGGALPEFAQKHPRWTKRVFNRADCLIAPSPFLAEKIRACGFDVQVISNVIELNLYPFRERSQIAPRLCWMRSFHPLYNPQMAVKVLAELRKTVPNATLTMAGVDKGLEPEIKQLAEKMNLSEAVHFPGFLNAAQKQQMFAEADIYLNTNHIDNMPVSVVEACAFGLNVVATKVGGVPYLLTHGENALLVEDDNVSEMVKAVKSLLNDSTLSQKLSQNGRRLAEQSSWSTVRGEWERLFSNVMSERQSKTQLTKKVARSES